MRFDKAEHLTKRRVKDAINFVLGIERFSDTRQKFMRNVIEELKGELDITSRTRFVDLEDAQMKRDIDERKELHKKVWVIVYFLMILMGAFQLWLWGNLLILIHCTA